MWLLLHGFTGSPQSWNRVVENAELGPALIPSLAGHSSHPWNGAIDSFESEVARLGSLLEDAQRPRLLCGYSLGARLALGLLSREPSLFDAAVLIGVHPGLAEEGARTERRELDTRNARLLREEGTEAFVAAWEELPLFESQRELPAKLRAEQRRIRLARDPEGLARSLEVLGLAEMPDYGAAMSSLEVPITLMAGSLDSKFSKMARELAAANAQVEVELVDGVGHNLLLEAPTVVAATLKRVEEASRR